MFSKADTARLGSSLSLPCYLKRPGLIFSSGRTKHFTMGPNEQNQHFAELRQTVCLYIHAVVLLRGVPSLEGKNELFVGKKSKKRLSQPSQTDYASNVANSILITLCHVIFQI